MGYGSVCREPVAISVPQSHARRGGLDRGNSRFRLRQTTQPPFAGTVLRPRPPQWPARALTAGWEVTGSLSCCAKDCGAVAHPRNALCSPWYSAGIGTHVTATPAARQALRWTVSASKPPPGNRISLSARPRRRRMPHCVSRTRARCGDAHRQARDDIRDPAEQRHRAEVAEPVADDKLCRPGSGDEARNRVRRMLAVRVDNEHALGRKPARKQMIEPERQSGAFPVSRVEGRDPAPVAAARRRSTSSAGCFMPSETEQSREPTCFCTALRSSIVGGASCAGITAATRVASRGVIAASIFRASA